MKQFQSKWLAAGNVIQVDDLSRRSVEQAVANALRSPQPVQIVFRSPWQHTAEQLRMERHYYQRTQRLRDRADREGWTSSELTTAMNNGCRIGRVTVRGGELARLQHEFDKAQLLVAVARIGGRDE